MNMTATRFPWKLARLVLAGVLVIVLLATSVRWWPVLSHWVQTTVKSQQSSPGTAAGEHAAESHAGHSHGDHEHAHDETTSLELSRQARQNLGLTPQFVRPIELQTFQRTITVPAVIVERPGRTNIQVSTPLTGVIEHVHAVTGEVVLPGSLLFEIRLTHEDLVQTQTEFLRSLGELDVETREIARLNEVAQSGAVAGKTLLERQYAKEKLEALLKAQREALRLHGLSARQVEDIVQQRHLLRELQILVPSPDAHGDHEEFRLSGEEWNQVAYQQPATPPAAERSELLLVIEQLKAHKGQSVAAGELLCTLADYSRLYIEGKAFEQDSRILNQALENGWKVTAIFDDERRSDELTGLKLAFIANAVDADSRSLSFFVDLPNEIVRDETNQEGQRFASWKFRVGQRLQMKVPVEEWPDQLVLPIDAVAREGAESYVFQENGGHFDRVPVHVQYRDQHSVVIANDGSIFPGDIIALRGAHQLQMALKNKSGGGVDPHAGHNH